MIQIEASKNAALAQVKAFCELSLFKEKNIEDFILLLLQENQKHNFIGKSTIEDVWNRHVLDSAQLMRFIPNQNLKFADLGTGAGFPGLLLSILGLKEIHLIEKSFRKCEFLRKAKLFSNNRIFIHQVKIEELSVNQFDCIVSRAFAPLDELLFHVEKFLKKDGFCLFLKGKNLSKEIAKAEEKFNFQYELFPSLTSQESSVIKITKIKQK